MIQSSIAVDRSLLQRSLTTLEERYRELRESAESRLQALDAEKSELSGQIQGLQQQQASQAAALAQAQAQSDQQAARVIELEADLARCTAEHATALQEKELVRQQLEVLQQRLEQQGEMRQRLSRLRSAL